MDDSGRKAKIETPKDDIPKSQLATENQELRRSPNVVKRAMNGPIGISNPYYLDTKPLLVQKPPPSQKSYPAPPPPSTKPILPKKKFAKTEGMRPESFFT